MVLQSSATIAASTQTDDVLVNNVLASNFRRPFLVRYAFCASAAGLLITLKVGLNIVADQLLPNIQNRYPLDPDDYLGVFGVIPGDRIILQAREIAAVNKVLFYTFKFQPA